MLGMWLYQPLDIQFSSPPRSATQKEGCWVARKAATARMLSPKSRRTKEEKRKEKNKKAGKAEKEKTPPESNSI